MKILIVHNLYQQRGGEDSVVDEEINLLRSRGNKVETYIRNNDDIAHLPRATVALQTLWSNKTVDDISVIISNFKPDVIHVHNTFPLISPSLYWVAEKFNIPVVQTLHNFRVLCPQAMFLRERNVCEDCLGHMPWRGILHGCYRKSKMQSAVLASMLILHRGIGTWRNKVTRYIALNDFCRDKFIEGGLPEAKIVVKPNFVSYGEPENYHRSGFLFVGRLSHEKGLDVLVSAFKKLDGLKLTVIGGGAEVSKLKGIDGLQALGQLSKAEVQQHMQRAKALIVPSIWYETFGLVVIEAFANGLPVIASNIGVLTNLVIDEENGLLFNPGDSDDLVKKIRWIEENSNKLSSMGSKARNLYEQKYTANQNYNLLMAIYNDSVDDVLQ